MTRPQKPNIRRIAFKRQCFSELEKYLKEREMQVGHQEFVLDLAALIDFLESENYVGVQFIASALQERLKTQMPMWEKLANRHVPEDWEAPDIQLNPEN
jgi:hypothetical protein